MLYALRCKKTIKERNYHNEEVVIMEAGKYVVRGGGLTDELDHANFYQTFAKANAQIKTIVDGHEKYEVVEVVVTLGRVSQ